MKLISIAFLLIFVFFIGNSIYNLIIIFQVPVCTKDEVCYKSFLNSKPNLALLLYYSNKITPKKYDLIFKDLQFNYKLPVEKVITINLSEADRNNASLLIHTVLLPTKNVKGDLELRELVDSPSSTYVKKSLTKYAVPVSTTFSLLTDGPNVTKTKPVSHIRSKFGLVMCADELLIPQMKIPPEFMRLFRFDSKRQFLPLLHIDNMQIKDRDLVEISESTGSINFTLYYNPISFGKLRFILQVEEVLKQFRTLGFSDKDLDDVKSVFADTNLYLLCLTVFISSVHLLLDFLSFKNDISFWRNHKSMAGLSTTAILWRAFAQIVIFLYLLDEGTSLIVLVPSGVGAVIEIWKVLKTFKGSFSFTNFQFVREKTETDAEAKTRQYDEECMKSLSYLLYPLCLSAALYSLIYQSHKSWYSWFINSLVNGVYAFGFLFMLPQLFINYKLKSVAALPWRVFTYKAFNTFIDDVFAFIITMPTAHRVACFRDDIVFFIYLYQRWLYPIDKSRVDSIDFEITETVETKKKES